MLELAKQVVEAEKDVDLVEERDRAKEALTELFEDAKGTNTHVIVKRMVTDIDHIVKKFGPRVADNDSGRAPDSEGAPPTVKYRLRTDQELLVRHTATSVSITDHSGDVRRHSIHLWQALSTRTY
ncbi:hypothetical protein [Tunturiibacter gelidiferens]|uniref:hypothetical protein n=1 Tax=Tunturiibacter gelidiferens TaxID=3069689 RepID=UPI003D9AB92E